MKTLLLNLVSTNSGWLARQAIKWSAVLAAAITAWLIGKGFDTAHASVIAAGVTSAALGLIEFALSFVARKYAVPAAEEVRLNIDKLREQPPTVKLPAIALLLGCTLLLSSCSSVVAFLASPAGKVVESAAVTLGKDLALKGEVLTLRTAIDKVLADIAKYEAQGVRTNTTDEIVRQSKLAGLQTVLTALQQQYKGATGQDYPIVYGPKQPVSVNP